MSYYSALLNIDYKKVVIVGGGHVARQKLESLLPTKANIVIISPALHESIQAYLPHERIVWKEKTFEPGDLDDAALIFAVTDQTEVNDAVEEATQHWQLLSRADMKGRVDFINPAVVRRGDLILSVSTSGASPGLTRKIKQQLVEQYDDTYERYVAFLREAREQILQNVKQRDAKKKALDAMLNAQLLEWVKENEMDKCHAFLQQILTGE